MRVLLVGEVCETTSAGTGHAGVARFALEPVERFIHGGKKAPGHGFAVVVPFLQEGLESGRPKRGR